MDAKKDEEKSTRYTYIKAGEIQATIQDERLDSKERNAQVLELLKETKKIFKGD